MRIFALALLALVLVGCVTAPRPIAAAPICRSDDDCTVKWAAARTYVLSHAGVRMQTYSADFMQTYPPPEFSPYLAAEVNKEPVYGGGYAIVAKFWCNNLFGCQPQSPRDALDQFNVAVSSVQGRTEDIRP